MLDCFLWDATEPIYKLCGRFQGVHFCGFRIFRFTEKLSVYVFIGFKNVKSILNL